MSSNSRSWTGCQPLHRVEHGGRENLTSSLYGWSLKSRNGVPTTTNIFSSSFYFLHDNQVDDEHFKLETSSRNFFSINDDRGLSGNFEFGWSHVVRSVNGALDGNHIQTEDSQILIQLYCIAVQLEHFISRSMIQPSHHSRERKFILE